MSDVFTGLEPKLVWKHFYNLNQIPRCSKHEEAARNYVLGLAKELGLEYKTDQVGNVVVKKAASPGMENKPTVIIQGHLDMVCEKNKNTVHDFSKDAIEMLQDDGWVTADGTTLGADNGVGLCMGLALLEDNSVAHPPLEIFATIDEETGMTGAMGLKPGFLEGSTLLNLDSEEEGALYIGCAGGKHTIMRHKIDWQEAPAGNKTVLLKISGLRGGHSGLNIIDGFGNAIKLTGRILTALAQKHDFNMVDFQGGTAHNAIPREAHAILSVDNFALDELGKLADYFQGVFNAELRFVEKDIRVTIDEPQAATKVMPVELSKRLSKTLYAMPDGVMAMSHAVEGLVETSTNLAVAEIVDGDTFFMLTSQRSSVATAIDDIAGKMRAFGELAGFEIEQGGGYPAWQPNPDSQLLKTCKKVYKDMMGKEPEVKAIHAGLECGIIGEQFSSMDMISFGPDITGAHSPDERVRIASVQNVWNYLVQVLKNL